MPGDLCSEERFEDLVIRHVLDIEKQVVPIKDEAFQLLVPHTKFLDTLEVANRVVNFRDLVGLKDHPVDLKTFQKAVFFVGSCLEMTNAKPQRSVQNLAEGSRKFAVQASEVTAIVKIIEGNAELFSLADVVVSQFWATRGADEGLAHLLLPFLDLCDLG